jgi:hypothetical protein
MDSMVGLAYAAVAVGTSVVTVMALEKMTQAIGNKRFKRKVNRRL